MAVTISDFTIVFSTVSDRPPLVLDDKATVHLAPMSAKLLSASLQMGLDAYEAQFGKMELPPKIRAQMDAHKEVLIKHLADQVAPLITPGTSP
jgi:hypothetical protein